jgi:hypothetical protein
MKKQKGGEQDMAKQSRGRGWFGNSAAHAAAGRKGGLAKKKSAI